MTKQKGTEFTRQKRPRQPTVSSIAQDVYVAYPEAFTVGPGDFGALPGTYMSESDLAGVALGDDGEPTDVGLFWFYSKYFKETGDPLMALKTFERAHAAKVYPPLPVLEIVATGIREYFESDGSKTFEECFGLRKNWQNQKRKPKTEWERQRKYYRICWDIVVWQRVFGLRLDLAMSAAGLIFGCSAQTIMKYQTHVKAHPEWRDVMRRVRADYLVDWKQLSSTEEGKRWFISQYALDDLKRLNVNGVRIEEEVLRYHKNYALRRKKGTPK